MKVVRTLREFEAEARWTREANLVDGEQEGVVLAVRRDGRGWRDPNTGRMIVGVWAEMPDIEISSPLDDQLVWIGYFLESDDDYDFLFNA